MMVKNLGWKPERVHVIHGGVDTDIFGPSDAAVQAKARKSLSVDPSQFVLLSLGHLGKIKGHDTTIRAMPTLLKNYPNCHLYIGGDGIKTDYQRLKQLINELKVVDNITLLGQINNPESWLHACDLFVQPSLEEGFGLVFVEAGACGKAVVATSVGGIPDIIIEEETGILVSPGNVQQLQTALMRLIADDILRQKMGVNARPHIVKNFSISNMIDKYEQLFKFCLTV